MCYKSRENMTSIPENRLWKDLFDAYRELPALWKINHPDHKDKIKKQHAWEALLRVYKRIDKEANVTSIKQRIHNIKAVFRRECKKVEHSIKFGAGPDYIYVPNLWYFHNLEFLNDDGEISPSISFKLENNNNSLTFKDEFDSFIESPPFKKQRKYEIIRKPDEEYLESQDGSYDIAPTTLKIENTNNEFEDANSKDMFEEVLVEDYEDIADKQQMKSKFSKKINKYDDTIEFEKSTSKTLDEADIYAQVWATSFRKVDDAQKLLCKKAIDDVLFLAEMGELNMNTIRSGTNSSDHITKSAVSVQTESCAESIELPRKSNPVPDINIRMNEKEFLKSCLALVTVSNLPLRIFDDCFFFKSLIRPYENLFNLNLNRSNITNYVDEYAARIQSILIQRFCNKMFNLKVDMVSRMGKTVLGLHVQYAEDFQIVINTIAIIPVDLRCTDSTLIYNKIIESLKMVHICARQIYSVTCDSHSSTSHSVLLRQIIEDAVEKVASEYCEFDQSKTIKFNSALLILESAVADCIKTVDYYLNECREVIKTIRKLMKKSNSQNIQMPKLDTVGNWISTFEMVASLKSLENNISAEQEFHLEIEIDWAFVELFVEAFTPLNDCWKQMQTEVIVVGDFYRDWLMCEAKLKKLNHNEYAITLLRSIKNIKQEALGTDAFLSALYLDPRFNFFKSPFFNSNLKEKAMEHLIQIHSVLMSLDIDEEGDNKFQTNLKNQMSKSDDPYDLLESLHFTSSGSVKKRNEQISTSQVLTDDPYIILEEELDSMSEDVNSDSTLNIRQKLTDISCQSRLPFSANILQHWKNRTQKCADVERIAEVVLSSTCNQFSTDRSLSALSTILTKKNSNISSEKLHNILLIKLNRNIFEEITI